MYQYGQYCPIARASEILGDRWTLLIVRDLLLGIRHFNDLERGLPGISRSVLSERLQRLERMGLLEKRATHNGRRTTEYVLTEAGAELQSVINALLTWGATWAFGGPRTEELDPVLLLWWMRDRVIMEHLPDQRILIEFDFSGPRRESFWLLIADDDVSVCLTYPGFEVNVLVTADLSVFYQLWLGRLSYREAISEHGVRIDGIPAYIRAFPRWFAWSPVAPTVRTARRRQQAPP
ncbi:MAG: helix-turn-helix transcriptional regulator [Chloroflexi bacterium]|nr:helix-turn-helix transcriptional regulator [Chloroflexota bacterium]